MRTKDNNDTNHDGAKPLSLEFDPTEFMHFLADTDWTDEQKAEYISLIWQIVREFVAIGFDVHPLQQAQKACGQPSVIPAQPALSGSDMVNSPHSQLIEEFVSHSGSKPLVDEEGVTDA